MVTMARTIRCFVSGMILLAVGTAPVTAQDSEAALTVELNGLEQVDKACRMTFVVENALAATITKAVFEVALFDAKGLVERLMVLDFRDLPKSRTRVRQFDAADTSCGAVSRILVNDATECAGEGLDPAACIAALRTSTTTQTKFGS